MHFSHLLYDSDKKNTQQSVQNDAASVLFKIFE